VWKFFHFDFLIIGIIVFFLCVEDLTLKLNLAKVEWPKIFFFKSSLTSIKDLLPTSSSFSDAESINILNIFVKSFVGLPKFKDEYLANLFYNFAQTKKEQMHSKRVRRLTFCVVNKRSQPSYFTYRAGDDFKEDKIYRNLEPALALEIYRLRSFHLQRIPTSNLKIHLYLGKY